jgi:DNA-binding transcriptional MerR regulator
MDDTALWTLDELSELVAGALRVDYPGQSSRRVREVPDRRTIRWYTTIGLLDRPAAMRGRTALYARRHLIQLVAVKRLQAQGRSLVEVQAELVGATDATLEGIARVPAGLVLGGGLDIAVRDDATGTREAEAAKRSVPPLAPTPALTAPAADAAPTRSARRFWAALPAEASPGVDGDGDGDGGADDDTASPRTPTTVPAIQLGSGVVLLVMAAGRPYTNEDLDLIEEAARPLLDLLRRRGLDVPEIGRETL